jgi:hypothetical protein
MIRRTWLALVLLCVASLSADAPRGTVPRSSADRYPAHAYANGFKIGASLLTQADAKKNFATDVNRCCLVVEVALYPEKDNKVQVSLNDFVLRIAGTDTAAKPSSASLLAAVLTKRPESTESNVSIHPTVGVGYETGGLDPTGRRAGGVVTSAGVGVGIGGPAQPPGATDRDRRTMETELSEKGLPEGTASAPVSGYLYFSFSDTKTRKSARRLEYTVNGEKTILNLQ